MLTNKELEWARDKFRAVDYAPGAIRAALHQPGDFRGRNHRTNEQFCREMGWSKLDLMRNTLTSYTFLVANDRRAEKRMRATFARMAITTRRERSRFRKYLREVYNG